MRLGTYNVHKLLGYAADPDVVRLDPEAASTAEHFARVLEPLDCDVLALQEVASAAQMSRIAHALDMQAVVLASPVRWPGYLLSRHPVELVRGFDRVRAHDPRLFTRSGGLVRVEVRERVLGVLALHLHPHDAEVREREGLACARMASDALETGDAGLVVLGDFNCDVGEAPHRGLSDLGLVAALPDTVSATVDTIGVPPRRVDHVYLAPRLASASTVARVVRSSGYRSDHERELVASDHLPVLVDLDAAGPW